MVSAVFHSPLEAKPVMPAAKVAAPARPLPPAAAVEPVARAARDWRAVWLLVLPPVLGFALLVLVWELVALRSTTGFPSPLATWQQALTVFSDPFYSKGPNDQGVGSTAAGGGEAAGLATLFAASGGITGLASSGE